MLSYKKATQIYNSVAVDLKNYADENMIDYGTLVKVIKECNALLGLDINQEKETILEVCNSKVKLPADFVTLNFALVCGKEKIVYSAPTGFQVEIEKAKSCQTTCSNEYNSPITIFQCCDEGYKIIDEVNVVKLVQTASSLTSGRCINEFSTSELEIKIKDGWIYTNFEEGNVYLNYNALMEDEDGDLIVLDHDLVNPYYEWACKKKIFTDLYLTGDDNVERRLSLVNKEFEFAKRQALLVKNMPEFYEIQELFRYNRSKFYKKYYEFFDQV
jgi:hypothetical protein